MNAWKYCDEIDFHLFEEEKEEFIFVLVRSPEAWDLYRLGEFRLTLTPFGARQEAPAGMNASA